MRAGRYSGVWQGFEPLCCPSGCRPPGLTGQPSGRRQCGAAFTWSPDIVPDHLGSGRGVCSAFFDAACLRSTLPHAVIGKNLPQAPDDVFQNPLVNWNNPDVQCSHNPLVEGSNPSGPSLVGSNNGSTVRFQVASNTLDGLLFGDVGINVHRRRSRCVTCNILDLRDGRSISQPPGNGGVPHWVQTAIFYGWPACCSQ